MSEHTPEPWAYLDGEILGPEDRDGDDTVIGVLGTSSFTRCAAHSVVRSKKKMAANGRLIAESPKMLRVISALVDRDIEFHGSEIRISTESHGQAIKLVADARAAIAAATGGEA